MSKIIYLNNQVISVERGSVKLPEVGGILYVSEVNLQAIAFKVLVITPHRSGFEIDVEVATNV